MRHFQENKNLVKSFDGSKCKILGSLNTKINFGPFSKQADLAVIKNLSHDVIIGCDLANTIFVDRCERSRKIKQIHVNNWSIVKWIKRKMDKLKILNLK